MFRQLGNPTWFCPLSAAEMRGTYDIENMTWQQKSDLIQKDPVTCARNFEHIVQLFLQ